MAPAGRVGRRATPGAMHELRDVDLVRATQGVPEGLDDAGAGRERLQRVVGTGRELAPFEQVDLVQARANGRPGRPQVQQFRLDPVRQEGDLHPLLERIAGGLKGDPALPVPTDDVVRHDRQSHAALLSGCCALCARSIVPTANQRRVQSM